MTRAGGSGAPRNGPSFDLDAAMKTRMENTFGDLSAVRRLGNRAEGADKAGSMVPAPAGETAYTGPVTHTLSDSSPSPASAGAMQAKRGWSFKKPKPDPKLKS